MISNPKVLNSMIRELRNKIQNETIECSKVLESLQQEVPAYHSHLESLNREIKILRIEKNKNIESEEIDKQNISESFKTDSKFLYKRISQKCHPDKTDDNKLNEKFKEAKVAYENNSLSRLLEIYIETFGDAEININFDSLQSEYQSLKSELDKIHTSVAHQLKQYYKENNLTAARELFLKFLFNQIHEAENLKDQLQKQ